MALFNYATKEITLKIVYYGPGLSGKTTNLQYLHSNLNPATKGKLLSLATEADRTLFFDFLPVELGKIRDFSIRFQLYTVPGQIRYNATRKVVLKGADAVVFVADSQRQMKEQNIESLENMKENLISNNINPEEIPIVFQYNKRDLQNILSLDELNADINLNSKPFLESSALEGKGVEETYKLITKLLLKNVSKKHKIEVHPMPATEDIPLAEAEKKQQAAASVLLETAFEPEPASTVSTFSEQSADLSVPDITEDSRLNYPERVSAKEIFPDDEPESAMQPPSGKDIQTRPAKRDHEVSGIPLEQIEKLVEEVTRISNSLSDTKKTLSALNNSVSALRHEVRQIQGMKKSADIQNQLTETNSLLQAIFDVFSSLKTRKQWFRF